jgi:hypothetical protein
VFKPNTKRSKCSEIGEARASLACAEQVLRARFFRFEPGPFRGFTRTLKIPDSVRLALPRPPNLICSIGGPRFSVKKKTQTVADFLPLGLLVAAYFADQSSGGKARGQNWGVRESNSKATSYKADDGSATATTLQPTSFPECGLESRIL